MNVWNKMAPDSVILLLLLITVTTCRVVTATCNTTTNTSILTTCSIDTGPLKKLFIPVDVSICECRCQVNYIGNDVHKVTVQVSKQVINKADCSYKITAMDYMYELNCENDEILDFPVNKTKSFVFSIMKDSSTTDSTSTGFCLNVTILQGMFNISCRPTSIADQTKTNLIPSTESILPNTTVINTNTVSSTASSKDIVVVTTTKSTVINTSKVSSTTNTNIITQTVSNSKTTSKPISEFPVIAVVSGIAGGVVVVIIIIIVFICFMKKKRNYDKPLTRTQEDRHDYQNMQNERLENNQETRHDPPSAVTSDVIVDENDMYVSYDDSRLIRKPPAINHEGTMGVSSDKTTDTKDCKENVVPGLYTTSDNVNDSIHALKGNSDYETIDGEQFHGDVKHSPTMSPKETPDVNDNVYTLVNKKPVNKQEPNNNIEMVEESGNVVYAVSNKKKIEKPVEGVDNRVENDTRRAEDVDNMYAVVNKKPSLESETTHQQKPIVGKKTSLESVTTQKQKPPIPFKPDNLQTVL